MPDLSPHLHTEECNKWIKQLQDCYGENQVGKWFGNCDKFQVQVDRCLKNERENNRSKNREAARQRKEEIQKRFNNQES